MKWLKIGLGILVFLLLLVTLAIVAITQWVDPNQYKPQITEIVEQNLGRKVAIDGDIQLSFFPWLGVKLGSTILNNPDDFQQQPFAAVQQAHIKVKLLPLFSQQIQIGQIQLDGVQLLLIQRADGTNNWQDLVQANENTEQQPDTPQQQNVYLENLQIEGLSLKNSSVVFIDEIQQSSYALQDANLQTSAITLDQAIQIQLDTTVNASQLSHTSDIQLQTALTLDLNQQIFQFSDLHLSVDSKLLPDKMHFDMTTVKLDLNQQYISIPEVVIQTLGGTVKADLKANEILSAPQLKGSVKLQQPKLQTISKILALPTLPVKSATMNFDFQASSEHLKLSAIQAQFDQYPFEVPHIEVDLVQQKAEIEKFNFEFLGTTFDLNQVNIQNFAQPTFSTRLQLTDLNLKKWLPLLKLPEQKTVDKKALTQIDLHADVKGDLHKVQLQNLAIKLDQTKIKGEVELSQFENPIISLRLEADKLDADKYMPPPTPNQKASQPLLPLDLLKALNVKGHIKLRKLTITQMQLQDINLQLID